MRSTLIFIMIKAILLDIGNVIIDYFPERFVFNMKEQAGISEMDIVRYFLLQGGDKDYTEGKVTSDEFFDQVSSDLKFDLSKEKFKNIWNEIFGRKEDMESLIRKLKSSYPVWALSNTNDWHIEYVKVVYPILLELDQLFLSHELKCQKPDIEIYKKVLDATGLAPEEIFFTDDVKKNIDAAKKIGFKAHHFKSSEHFEHELKSLGVLL